MSPFLSEEPGSACDRVSASFCLPLCLLIFLCPCVCMPMSGYYSSYVCVYLSYLTVYAFVRFACLHCLLIYLCPAMYSFLSLSMYPYLYVSVSSYISASVPVCVCPYVSAYISFFPCLSVSNKTDNVYRIRRKPKGWPPLNVLPVCKNSYYLCGASILLFYARVSPNHLSTASPSPTSRFVVDSMTYIAPNS